jgi:hypothetical protein
LTGTTTITGFTGTAGVTYHCRADEAFTLTHDATDLIITQTAANVTTASGDTFDVHMLTGSTCRIINYRRKNDFTNTALGAAPVYACRAWVNFDGEDTVAITESGNVSSITDNTAGDYTVNFTTAMPDANYSVAGVCNSKSGVGSYLSLDPSVFPTTTDVTVLTVTGNTAVDRAIVCVAIFR